jgi:hypothetical protein
VLKRKSPRPKSRACLWSDGTNYGSSEGYQPRTREASTATGRGGATGRFAAAGPSQPALDRVAQILQFAAYAVGGAADAAGGLLEQAWTAALDAAGRGCSAARFRTACRSDRGATSGLSTAGGLAAADRLADLHAAGCAATLDAGRRAAGRFHTARRSARGSAAATFVAHGHHFVQQIGGLDAGHGDHADGDRNRENQTTSHVCHSLHGKKGTSLETNRRQTAVPPPPPAIAAVSMLTSGKQLGSSPKLHWHLSSTAPDGFDQSVAIAHFLRGRYGVVRAMSRVPSLSPITRPAHPRGGSFFAR